MARNIVPWAPKLAQVSSKAKYTGPRLVPVTSRVGWCLWIGFLVVFGASLVLGDKGLVKARAVELQLNEVTQAKAGLQQEFDALSRDLAVQKNDPRSYEKPAREKYRMVKEGEQLYLFEDDGIVPAGPWDGAWTDENPDQADDPSK